MTQAASFEGDVNSPLFPDGMNIGRQGNGGLKGVPGPGVENPVHEEDAPEPSATVGVAGLTEAGTFCASARAAAAAC